jgi:hypothetical protein
MRAMPLALLAVLACAGHPPVETAPTPAAHAPRWVTVSEEAQFGVSPTAVWWRTHTANQSFARPSVRTYTLATNHTGCTLTLWGMPQANGPAVLTTIDIPMDRWPAAAALVLPLFQETSSTLPPRPCGFHGLWGDEVRGDPYRIDPYAIPMRPSTPQ